MQRGEYHDIYDAGFDEAGNPIPASPITYQSDYQENYIMGNIIRMLNNRTPKSIRYRNKKRSEKYLRSKSSRKMVDRKIKSDAIEKILQQEFEKEVSNETKQ